MKKIVKPRLRYFEESPGQRHIVGDDRYLYRHESPRYRLAIIGSGTIGQEHMRVARMLGAAAVHGIYDRNAHSMKVAAEEHARHTDDTLLQYASLADACSDDAVDAFMICTPNASHIEVIEQVAKTAKPILLEKPMATNVADARRIIEIASDYPSFIQVGLQYRYKAAYVEARHEALERASVGEIKTLSISEYRPPFLDKVEQWNKFSECSGGTLIEKCCHYFDLLNMFAGAVPARVFASGGQAVNFLDFERDGRTCDIDDHAFVIIDYANGIRANFTLNMFSPHFYEELVICGDRGRLVASERFDFLQDDVAQSHIAIERGEDGASRETAIGYARPIEQSGHHGATYHEHIAFVEQLDGKQTDAATPLQGLWSIIVAMAAQESSHSGQAVEIDGFIQNNKLGALLGADSGD